jgi:hypothetical protein
LISRYLVIVLALGVAAMRASQGAWVEASGLTGLGLGLVCLKIAESRPVFKRVAYVSFLVTALAIGTVLFRRYG